ncbi:MAG: UDP-N-acetylmuramoyl-tripeptide--D-alanyl-D-alanine ligase [Planctomycetota bacterium]|jgi:UDP-N-acetylmuramoyl-tripeptide--D-alanyl-D-alanine ligase|nr:UDP-N-acetylmuramoyl-tripeptide--D-alanyl-D-alanine ligase [Planctomycetota bacterium]
MNRPGPFALEPEQAETLTGGRWHGARDAVTAHGAAIDSRRVTAGMLFACFKGEHVDGHAYAGAAVEAGAVLVLATEILDLSVPVLVVPSVAQAMAALAAAFRASRDDAVWIGVTGSNGKTTVKELIAAACGGSQVVHATSGNYNNELGVPLTILATPAEARFVVVEMGAAGCGQIAQLAAIAQPHIGVITSIGPAHLEGFGGIEGVARGKSELFAAITDGGRLLFARHGLEQVCESHAADVDGVLAIIRGAAAHGVLTVVGDPGCPVAGELADSGLTLRTPVGEVGLNLVGQHNLVNATLAWHAAVAAGVEPKQALRNMAGVRATSGRLMLKGLGQHRVLDDSYNANPASMSAGLGVLASQGGARIAVLGAMGELGATSEALHAQVGREAARLGVPVITVVAGAIAAGYRAAGGRDCREVETCDAAVELILERFAVGPTSVLVKASRSSGLDAVVRGLERRTGYGPGTGAYKEVDRC